MWEVNPVAIKQRIRSVTHTERVYTEEDCKQGPVCVTGDNKKINTGLNPPCQKEFDGTSNLMSNGVMANESVRGFKVDLTGLVFTWLTVIARAPRGKSYDTKWLCRCKCGNERIVYGISLRNGQSKSCGCYARAQTAVMNRTHGHCTGANGRRTRTWRIWMGMKQRVLNPKNPKFKDYGGRGIAVCDRWRDSFENFLADMGECPSNTLSIDRENNNGNYEPGNCRWATAKQQANNRRNTKKI